MADSESPLWSPLLPKLSVNVGDDSSLAPETATADAATDAGEFQEWVVGWSVMVRLWARGVPHGPLAACACRARASNSLLSVLRDPS